jgi:D-glycero-D-manno-heptose 1,7-bisphosphate phosphatase
MKETPMKLIILDRDGTINEDRDDFVKSPDEWVPLPGALEAIARLNQAGWHTVIATNQSGLGRGTVRHGGAERDAHQDEHGAGEAGRPHRRGVLLPACARRRVQLPQAAAGLFEQIGERFGVALGRARGRRFAARPAGRRWRRLPCRTWCVPAKEPRSTKRSSRS